MPEHLRGCKRWYDLADRRWLMERYLPMLSGRALYIGVEQYNDFYHDLAGARTTFLTLDIDPAKAIYGSPYGHTVGDMLDHVPDEPYDHVSLYGILGYYPTKIPWCGYHQKLDELTKPGGTVMVGHHVNGPYGMSLGDWLTACREPPFAAYEPITAGVPGVETNAIWWGRKPC